MPDVPPLDEIIGARKSKRHYSAPAGKNGVTSDPLLRKPRLVRLSDVRPERVEWLWPGRIPLGKLSLIGGDGGLGKSLLTMDLAARATVGRRWPDCEETRAPIDVLILTAEDDLADTVRPRIEAVGGDVRRITILESVMLVPPEQLAQSRERAQVEQVGHVEQLNVPRKGAQVAQDAQLAQGGKDEQVDMGRDEAFSLAADLPMLEAALRETGARLVIIDPITAYMGDTETHNDAKVRVVLRPLSELAARYHSSICGVMHLNKAVGRASQYRWTGSPAFLNAARAAHVVAMDKDDQEQRRRVFIPQKQNLSIRPPGLAFITEGATLAGTDPPIETARIVWEPGTVDITADEALAEADSAVEEAVEFLRETLEGRQIMAERVKQLARAAGISWASVRRAKRPAGVRHRKLMKHEDPAQPTVWYLAEADSGQRVGNEQEEEIL